jgi:hypothetical protein
MTGYCAVRPPTDVESRAGEAPIVALQDARHLLVTNSLGGTKRVVERFTYTGCFGPDASQVT